MSTYMADILKKLGWDDGFQIPIANEENKELEEELAKLSLRKAQGKNSLDIVSGRLNGLKEHFKYVSQENEQTQRLITAHKQQLESTQNEFHIAKAEKTNTEQATKTVSKKLKDAEERGELKKSDLIKHIATTDQLKAEMDWDAEALKAWEESLKKRDDDNELMKKFTKEDERKFNDLEAKRMRLQAECADKKLKSTKIASDTFNYELIIERSGKVIRQQQAERDALIRQWKDTVKMLQQRDNDIVNAQDQIANALEQIQKEEEKLLTENRFWVNNQRVNHDLSLEIQSLNAVNSRMRRDYNELTQYLLLINSELQTLKRQVSGSSHRLENERMKGKHLTYTIEEREILTERYERDVIKLHGKIEEMKNSTMNAAERIKKIEQMIDKEETLYVMFLADTEKINGILYRTERLLKDQKDIGKSLEIEINNITCNCAQLRKHITAEKKEVQKIKEVVYDMEFRIDDIEQRLYKITTDDSKQENYDNDKAKDIKEMEQTLAEYRDVQHALQSQIDRLEEEMRQKANLIQANKETHGKLQNKCENHLLVYEMGKKQIITAKQLTQEKQVEESMMKLRIDQIEKDKSKEEKQIYTLEKLRLNLDGAMKERRLEIDTKKSINQTKRRNLEEDRGRLRADIALRRLKIEQIQKKYHIALMSMGQDEDGQPITAAHYKIKAAQEKFLLQQEGDTLDQKIKQAEKEIVAMENTLKLLNLTNVSFKKSLAPVKDDDQEITEIKTLEQEGRQAREILKVYKTELAKKEKEAQEIQTELNDLDQTTNGYKEIVANLDEEIKLVRKQELEKSEKLQRADCHLKKVVKKLRNKDLSKYERDFEIRNIQDANRSVTKQLLQMCKDSPDMAPIINLYLTECNIDIPESRLTPSSNSPFSSIHHCSSSSSPLNTSTSGRTEHSNNSPASLKQINLCFTL